MKSNWHALSVENVLASLNTSKKGLTETEVKLRQQKYGLNKLPESKGRSNLNIFLSQFNSLLVYILIGAGVITFLMHEKLDAMVIFLAVIVNAIFGFWEEKKTVNIMNELKSILDVQVTVIRDGKKKIVREAELVPGDIIEVSAGDKVPADARLIEAEDLRVSEAVLTGESIASLKDIKKVDLDTSLADRRNMIYMGSLVESGKGLAVVVATGVHTETGKIVDFVQNTKEEKSPLQERLDKLSKEIAIIIGGAAFFIFIGGLFRGDNPIAIFEAGVAIAVGGIPESLPIVMTLVLAIGMERILHKKGLVRKLQSVETLGSTSVICFDKTRTLTKGVMELVKYKARNNDLKELFTVATITSEAEIEDDSLKHGKLKLIGTSTGRAIVEGAYKLGFVKNTIENNYETILETPFDSKLKFITKLVRDKKTNEHYIFVIGAPERILERTLNSTNHKWETHYKEMMMNGLRTIGIAKRIVKNPEKITKNNLTNQVYKMEFIGLLGLIDPLRQGIKSAIKKTTSAGIRPIIITGDHELTARAIAKDAGIIVKEGEYIEGRDIDKLSDKEFEKVLENLKLCARAEPDHKMRIVKTLQKQGFVVAMVGDGVNDAPAIKKADIGVALGSGTEVAKESSDLVLLNDSFAVIVNAVEQGRVIVDNLRKSIAYILADAFSSVIIIGISNIILGWPLPVLPVQILWNNLVEDSVPSIAYAFEPKEKGVMKRKPESKNTPLLNKEMKMLIFGTGLLDEFLTLAAFWYMLEVMHLDMTHIRTLIFGTMSLDTAFVIYAYKDLGKSIWNINLLSNKWLLASSVIVLLSYLVAVYIPFFNTLLHTIPLGIYDWLFLLASGIISLSIIETTKLFYIRSRKND